MDYYVIGNGYTLSRYEKKRFFTDKRARWLWQKVNDFKYKHLLYNKVDDVASYIAEEKAKRVDIRKNSK